MSRINKRFLNFVIKTRKFRALRKKRVYFGNSKYEALNSKPRQTLLNLSKVLRGKQIINYNDQNSKPRFKSLEFNILNLFSISNLELRIFRRTTLAVIPFLISILMLGVSPVAWLSTPDALANPQQTLLVQKNSSNLTNLTNWSNWTKNTWTNIKTWFSPQPAKAAMTQTPPLMGRLTTSTGYNVADGNYSITFSIYSAATGGTALWTETQTVPVDDGVWRVFLGSTTAISGVDFDSSTNYLGVKVGSDAEMSPRMQIGPGMQAIDADLLDGKHSTDFTLDWVTDNNAITTNAISVGQITSTGLVLGSGQITNSASTSWDLLSSSTDTTLTVTNSNGTYRANLSVEGQIRVGNFSSSPTALGGGSLYYNTTDNSISYYDTGSSSWVVLASGGIGGAPANATYLTKTANGTLTNETLITALDSHIVSATDNTYNLGSASNVWANGYFTNLLAGTGDALTITANSGSTWSTSSGLLTIQGAGGLTLTSTGGTFTLNAAGQTADIDASTLSLDGSTAINIGVTADVPIDIDSSTLDVDSSGALTLDSATSISIGTTADVAFDIDTSTLDIDSSGALTIDSASTFSIDGVGASNLSTTSGDLTVSTITSGTLSLTSAAATTINATAAALTLQTTTSGNVAINPASTSDVVMTLDTDGSIIDINDTANTTGTAIDITNTALTSGTALSIAQSTSSFIGKLLNLQASGGGVGTAYGLYSALTGAATTNVAGYFSATGATNNYGLIVENGRLGVGTPTPTSTVHVVGQCVTGDTLLKRRRRRKVKSQKSKVKIEGKKSKVFEDEEYEYDQCRIDQIQKGDEVLSLNEATGKFEYRKVNALMDMGIKPIYTLTTASGKAIRTTGNHPYFVKQSSINTSLLHDSFFDIIEAVAKKFYFEVLVKQKIQAPALNNDIINFSREGWNHLGVDKPKRSKLNLIGRYFALPKAITVLTSTPAKVDYRKGNNEDVEFWSFEAIIDGVKIKVVTRSIKGGTKHFYSVIWQGEQKQPQKGSTFEEAMDEIIEEIDTNKKRAVSRLYPRRRGLVTPQLQKQYNTFVNSLSSFIHSQSKDTLKSYHTDAGINTVTNNNGSWLKVFEISEGMEIAVSDDQGKQAIWDKVVSIKKTKDEQVFDIEIEGTHNFVGNEIVAHNTYLTATSGTILEARNAGAGSTLIAGDGTDYLSINSTGDITFTDANGAASITGPAGGDLDIAAGASQAIDIDATTINIDGSSAVNIGTTADAPFDIDTSTLDIDSSGAITMDSTSTFSIDGVGASNVSTTSGDLTISTITSGTLSLTSAAATTINATAAALTLQTTTSGNIAINPASTSDVVMTLDTDGSQFTITDTANTTNDTLAITSSAQTTGSAIVVTQNALTSGYALEVTTSSTAFTGALLFANSTGSGATGKLIQLQAESSDMFAVTSASSVFSNPVSFESPGDITMAYDLYFSNPTASYIKSENSLYIESGDPNGNYNLFLIGNGTGEVVIQDTALIESTTAQQLQIGYDSSNYAFMDIASDGAINIDTLGTDADLTIETENLQNAIVVDDSTTSIGLGVAAPGGFVEIDTGTGTGIALLIDQDDVDQTALDFDINNTAGDIINIDWGGATTQTAAIQGIDIDLTNLTTLAASSVYGIHINDAANSTTATEYGLYIEGTNWDYGIYNEDASYFGGASTYAGDITITKADPTLIYNVTTATDTDFWAGVTDDGDGVDDDLYQIGDGTIPGTNPFLTIDTSGQVGIGTAGPGDKLSISTATVDQSIALRLENTANPSVGNEVQKISSYMKRISDSTLVESAKIEFLRGDNTNAASFMAFSTRSNVGAGALNEAMRINHLGNVGIGDTSPSAKLEVGDGTDSIQFGSAGDITFVDADGAASITGPAGGALTVAAGASQALTLTANGASTWSTSAGQLDIKATSSALALSTVTSGNITINPASTSDIVATLDTDGSNFQITDTTNTTTNAVAISATALTTASALDISVNGTAAASNTQKALNIAIQGANATTTQTTYGAYIANTHTGTLSTNIAMYLEGSGATNNYALVVDNNNWISAKDNAETGYVNMIKINASDEIEVGGTLVGGSLEAVEDSGAITIFDMPVSSSSADNLEMSATFAIDGNNVFKVYGQSDGAGGADTFRTYNYGEAWIQKTDPTIVLDTVSATDTDFWIAVTEDAGGDDDDLFQIGDGTTTGTNPFLTIDTSGQVGIGDVSPSAKLEVGDGTDSIQFGSAGDITFVDADGAASITGPAGGILTLQSANSQNLALATQTAGNITLTTAAATGLVNILTGNLKVGNGVPDVALDAEDAYIEGTLEVDARIKMDTWTADGDTIVYKDDVTGNLGLVTSDIRLKKDITPLNSSLAKISSLQGFLYHDLSDQSTDKKRLGLSAQDVMAVLPEATFTFSNQQGQQYYSIHYEKLTALLVEGIKELNTLQVSQSAEITHLQNSLVDLNKQINSQKLAVQDAAISNTLTVKGQAVFESLVKAQDLEVLGSTKINGNLEVAQSILAKNIKITDVLTVGNNTDFAKFDQNGLLTFSGLARPIRTISLAPEYPAAIKKAYPNGQGKLTTDYEITQLDNHAFYNWTSADANYQEYEVSVRVHLPKNFSSWNSTDPVKINAWTDDFLNTFLDATVYDSQGELDPSITFANLIPDTDLTWQTINLVPSGTYTADSWITLVLHYSASNSANVRTGEITLDYLSNN